MTTDEEFVAWIENYPCVVVWLEGVAGKEWELLIQTERERGVDNEVWVAYAMKIWELLGSLCPFCKFVPDDNPAGKAVACDCAGKEIFLEKRQCVKKPIKEITIKMSNRIQ
jgi:hypothetical protein